MLTAILIFILLLSIVLWYWFPVRHWFNRWGTTPSEVTGSLPGDNVIGHPTNSAMQALTITAGSEYIWPWLVQIGYQRGGLYSYDWLDRLFGFLDRPSSKNILPQFQSLSAGDKIPWGRGECLTVNSIEPLKSLVLYYKGHGMEWVWQFALHPLNANQTRLITRGIERTPKNFIWRLGMLLMEPASFIMTRRMLFGVKQRAETLAGKNPGG
jgi:hypothetical protein